MSDAGINTAAVRVESANDNVVDPDERRKDAHRRDQPKRRIAADREGETDDVGFARTPVAVEDGSSARHIDIARSPNVGGYQMLLTRNRVALRDEATLLRQERGS